MSDFFLSHIPAILKLDVYGRNTLYIKQISTYLPLLGDNVL